MKRETKKIFFYVLTLGIGYYIIKNKSKTDQPINDALTVSNDFPFKLEDIYKCLGGKTNIVNVSSTINMLKVELKEIKSVDKDGLKKLGVKGMMQSEQTLSLVLGDYSKALERAITNNK